MDIFFYSQHSSYIVEQAPGGYLPVDVHDLLARLAAEPEVDPDTLESVYRRLCRRVRERTADLRETAIRAYRPFSPDRHHLRFRDQAPDPATEDRFLSAFRELLALARFEPVDRDTLHISLTEVSPFGLNLHIDLEDFECLEIHARGVATQVDWVRGWRTLYLRRHRVEFTVYRRLVLLFKLKCREAMIRDLMRDQGLDRAEATRRVRRKYRFLPADRFDQHIHIKLFKDTPQADLEMLLPNRGVRMKLLDQLKLVVTGTGSLMAGLISVIKKVFLTAVHPKALAMTLGSFVGVVIQQVMKYLAQRNEYLKYLSQKLYTHNLGSNRSVIGRVADRATEEPVKEALLVWYLLSTGQARVLGSGLDRAIGEYMQNRFGVAVRLNPAPALALLAELGLDGADRSDPLPQSPGNTAPA